VGSQKTELKGEMNSLRTELKGEMSSLRSELKGEMNSLRSELRGEMSTLRNEVKGEMKSLRQEVKSDIQQVLVSVHATQTLMEEQRNENKIVLEGLQGLFERQDRVESEVALLRKDIKSLKTI
jgi:gas vesicle protein